ncbi:hypothetical protein BDB01DRAFT_158599 [Pilobolus umbonatus]|nr:hypothetical protein BDB01DRAFT_277435 [Pilobolus umbonatus]KAI8982662.1 hypothetical protein BDB01DRAFT_158599 [Pilobolus umbonatus]
MNTTHHIRPMMNKQQSAFNLLQRNPFNNPVNAPLLQLGDLLRHLLCHLLALGCQKLSKLNSALIDRTKSMTHRFQIPRQGDARSFVSHRHFLIMANCPHQETPLIHHTHDFFFQEHGRRGIQENLPLVFKHLQLMSSCLMTPCVIHQKLLCTRLRMLQLFVLFPELVFQEA